MTLGRMHTMTQGTESISKAHRAALGCLAVARQLSVVVMVVSIIALVAGTVGTSYAKTKPPPKNSTEEALVVTNFGSLFEGSVETFAAGSFFNTGPTRRIKGNSTLLGAGTGASGDAQSSRDFDIAVAVPFAAFCGHGALAVWPAGTTGNAAPEEFLCGPSTGLFLDQGVAYRDPFTEIGVSATHSVAFVAPNDVIAVSNFGAIVVGSLSDPAEGCNPFELEGPPPAGTITECLGEQTSNVTPTPNFPVIEVPFPTVPANPKLAFTNN